MAGREGELRKSETEDEDDWRDEDEIKGQKGPFVDRVQHLRWESRHP